MSDYCFSLERDKLKNAGPWENVQKIVVGDIRDSKRFKGCLLDTGIILNNEFRSRVKLAPHSDDKIDRLNLRR